MRTDRVEYRAGDRITLTIRNDGEATWGYNACQRAIERDESGTWRAVPEADRVCTMELSLLGPRESRDARTTLPTGLAPGRYRLTLSFSGEGPAASGRLQVASRPWSLVP
jgi:hypothetical protein